MSGPKVSILTATYNSLDGLQETVASVESQTADDFEHIVIDGGSSDGSPEWLAEYDGEVKWTSEPDDGIADALNKGLEMARGEWILVLHAEDTFLNIDSLKGALPGLSTSADVVSHDVLFQIGTGSRRWASRGFSPMLNFKTTIPHHGAFVRQRLFERVGQFDTTLRIGLDYDFFLRAYRLGARADVASDVLSIMPDTGVSSRLDWPSLRVRFQEEHAIHARHSPGISLSTVYRAYWPLYLSYRRVRHEISQVRNRSDPMRSG